MTEPAARPTPSSSDGTAVVQAVTLIMSVVVGLTFLFGFGNVLNLALRLGVPGWVAPLVAPAVDLSILGFLLGSRHLALAGVSSAQLRPARRLLIFASLVTLALNVTDPLIAAQYGKAAFDAVGPLLLIGWAEVGPDLLKALATEHRPTETTPDHVKPSRTPVQANQPPSARQRRSHPKMDTESNNASADKQCIRAPSRLVDDDLLERAKAEDAHHWAAHRRPISADTLRKKLRISTARSRLLVTMIRTDSQRQSPQVEVAARLEGDGRLTAEPSSPFQPELSVSTRIL